MNRPGKIGSKMADNLGHDMASLYKFPRGHSIFINILNNIVTFYDRTFSTYILNRHSETLCIK